MLLLANIILVIAAMTGMWMIAHYRKEGFVVFLLVETSMGYIGMRTHNYGLVIAAILYLCMNIYSYLKWSNKL